MLESGLQAKDIIQVSMDGPSVKWKFYGELKKKVNNDYGTTLINIGSCGLHVVHNSFKEAWMLLDGKCLRFFPVCTISLRMLLPEEKTSSPYLAAL